MAEDSLVGDAFGGVDIASAAGGFIFKLALVVGGTLIIGLIAIIVFDRWSNRRDYNVPHFMIKEMGQGRPKGIVSFSAYDANRRVYRDKDNVIVPDHAWENKLMGSEALLTYARNIDDVMPVLIERPPNGLLERALLLLRSQNDFNKIIGLRTPLGMEPALYLGDEDSKRVILSTSMAGLDLLRDAQAISLKAGQHLPVEILEPIGMPVVASEHYAVAYPPESVKTRVVPDPSTKTVIWGLLKENASRFTLSDWLAEHGPMLAQVGGVLILLLAMVLGFRYIGGDIKYQVEIVVRQFVESGGLDNVPVPTAPPGPPPGYGGS